jgi:hypothetical protein
MKKFEKKLLLNSFLKELFARIRQTKWMDKLLIFLFLNLIIFKKLLGLFQLTNSLESLFDKHIPKA